jgi:hypothetical protein
MMKGSRRPSAAGFFMYQFLPETLSIHTIPAAGLTARDLF